MYVTSCVDLRSSVAQRKTKVIEEGKKGKRISM